MPSADGFLKRFLFGFILGIVLSSVHGVKAQATVQRVGPTEREIIEILADYDVRHVQALPAYRNYGVTDFNGRTIYILDNQDFVFKRRTVDHELIHVVRRMRLQELEDRDEEEAAVGIIEEAEYRRLFLTQ